MQLVNGVTIIHNLESSHHVARNTRLLLVTDLFSHWVVLSDGLSLLVVVVSLRLQPPLYRLYVVLPIRTRTWTLQCDLLWVRLPDLPCNSFFLKQFCEIRDQFLEGDRPDAFGLQRRDAHLAQDSYLDEDPPKDLVHTA
jgi:hypothetical protein